MIAVATGGPRIQSKNDEYKERRELIRGKLQSLGKRDPNPFDDLWAWYGRWSQRRSPELSVAARVRACPYRGTLEDLAGAPAASPSEPAREPTGWER